MLAAIASFTFIGAAVLTIFSGSGGGGNEGGGGGRPACAKHLNSFAFIGAAAVAIASGGDVGSGGRNGDMEEMNACTTISLKRSNGGNDHNEESWQRGRGRRRHDGRRR